MNYSDKKIKIDKKCKISKNQKQKAYYISFKNITFDDNDIFRKNVVYEMILPDGHSYIGQTSTPLCVRIGNHLNLALYKYGYKPYVNEFLATKLKSETEIVVNVLGKGYRNKKARLNAEAKFINEKMNPKLLNRLIPRPSK